jgi:YidC/Oxa1 family membrane protein insertase
MYFAAAVLPPLPAGTSVVPASLTVSGRQAEHRMTQNGTTTTVVLPEMAAGSTMGNTLSVRLFVGPKDLDVLKTIQPPLDTLVDFGSIIKLIAEPLFYTLRWLYGFIPNYGWAIVLMTVAINMLLYPLKLKSWRSMQKMQRVAPEVKAIQERYKKYSMRDPRKQEMNKEVMAIYSREGINPMGSCLPMLAQLPIWWGLYRMLTVTIELRHAPWIVWVRDLSKPDPYYILPVMMAVLMWVAQKMTPMTVTDPAQQRMMTMMPLIFGGMFIVFPVSSGLVLYILASNIVAIGQQWYLNRTAPLKAPAAVKNKRK